MPSLVLLHKAGYLIEITEKFMSKVDVLKRMSLFEDSNEIAEVLAFHDSDYYCVEGSQQIKGLWKLTKEMGKEIQRLRKNEQKQKKTVHG